MVGRRLDVPALRVLLVDDSPLNRALTGHMLGLLGCKVDTASTGSEAIALAERGYDVVVMDLNMPGMDGRSASLLMHARERDAGTRLTPVIVLSADEPTSSEHELWCAAYLTKPATLDELKRAVARVARDSPSPSFASVAEKLELDSLVGDFLVSAAQDVEDMRGALERGDYATIGHKAHGLKGMGGSFGFPVISSLGAQLENEARNASPERIRSWLQQLDTILSF